MEDGMLPALLTLVLVVVIYMVYRNPTAWTWLKTNIVAQGGDVKTLGIIAGALLVFNLVVRSVLPPLWNILNGGPGTLFFFNLGFFVVSYLATLKSDENGKQVPNITARKWATRISWVLIAGLIYTGVTTNVPRLSKGWTEIDNPALAIIAECKPSDFNTEEKVAKALELYKEKGVDPWEDKKECWIEKIPRGINYLKIIDAPVGHFGRWYIIPTGFKVDGRETEGAFVAQSQKGQVAIYDLEKGIDEDLPLNDTARVRFKSGRDTPLKVRLRVGHNN